MAGAKLEYRAQWLAARCLNIALNGWHKAWVSCPMAGGAMLEYGAQWLAQSLGIAPGGAMLEYCAQLVESLGIAPNSGAMLEYCAQWLAAQCLYIVPNGWHEAWIVRLIAARCLNIQRLAQSLGIAPNGWRRNA